MHDTHLSASVKITFVRRTSQDARPMSTTLYNSSFHISRRTFEEFRICSCTNAENIETWDLRKRIMFLAKTMCKLGLRTDSGRSCLVPLVLVSKLKDSITYEPSESMGFIDRPSLKICVVRVKGQLRSRRVDLCFYIIIWGVSPVRYHYSQLR